MSIITCIEANLVKWRHDDVISRLESPIDSEEIGILKT